MAEMTLFTPVEPGTFSFELGLADRGYEAVAGVDEAGRGPLAGPVVAGAVILPINCQYDQFKDSKKLSPRMREKLFVVLREMAVPVGVGLASPEEIDRINILQASLLAMKRAVLALERQADYLLVDGKFQVPLALPQQALVKGESKSASIAAASIIAKVSRDRLMTQYHQQFPEYHFDRHKGYPTALHRQLVKELGPCKIHRRSFKGVREFIVKG
jgi:ribonuclease HII